MSDETVYLNHQATNEEQWVSKKEASSLVGLTKSTIDKLWMNTPEKYYKYARSPKGQRLKLVLKTYVLEQKGDTKIDNNIKAVKETQKESPFDDPAVQKVLQEKDSRIEDLKEQLGKTNEALKTTTTLLNQEDT